MIDFTLGKIKLTMSKLILVMLIEIKYGILNIEYLVSLLMLEIISVKILDNYILYFLLSLEIVLTVILRY